MCLHLGGTSPDALRARKLHDDAAYASARPAAEREVLQLLLALRSDGTPEEVARRAKAVSAATGLLWETAARLTA